jgi:hypothetical protein
MPPKFKGAFYSQATVKRLGQNKRCACIPGEIPIEVMVFLERILGEFL